MSPSFQRGLPHIFQPLGKIRFLPPLLNCPLGKQFESAIDLKKKKKKCIPQCLLRGLFTSENNTCGNSYFTILFIQELKPILFLQYVQSQPCPSPRDHVWIMTATLSSIGPVVLWNDIVLVPQFNSMCLQLSLPLLRVQFFFLFQTACTVVLSFVNVEAAEEGPFTLHPYKPKTDKRCCNGSFLDDQFAKIIT